MKQSLLAAFFLLVPTALVAKPLVIGLADICPAAVNGRSVSGVRPNYCRSVYASGNIPFIMSATTNREEIARVLDCVDALVLCGGEDVEPARYREAVSPACGKVNLRRDAWEWALLDEAVRRRLPVVGTCRGHQLINIYFGGSLYQDIPTECPGAGPHRGKLLHPIAIEPNSRLAEIVGSTNALVNTSHHQSVKVVAPGFRIVARGADGIVEAIESDEMPIAGVQFHPEAMFADRGEGNFLAFFTRILDWAGKTRGKIRTN